MRRIHAFLLIAATIGLTALTGRSEPYPKPSPYPKTWELDFEHSKPKRIIVAGDDSVPRAYWFVTYTVTNHTDREQLFLPVFELINKDGKVLRSDRSVPRKVFETIKKDEGNILMVNAALIGGELRLGQDEAKDGVAIWQEPDAEMGSFTIYLSGLSGETATVKGPDGKDVILRKSLELNYFTRGDTRTSGSSEVVEQSHDWVMR